MFFAFAVLLFVMYGHERVEFASIVRTMGSLFAIFLGGTHSPQHTHTTHTHTQLQGRW